MINKVDYENLYKLIIDEHEKVFKAQDFLEIEKLVDSIIKANRVFIVGAGREGIAARSFAMRIMHLGKDTFWVWDDTAPSMNEGDLFIAINGSGKIGHIDYLINRAKLTKAKILVITGSPNEETPKMADVSVFIPACVYKGEDKRVVNSLQPMGNLFEQHLFLLFDLVIILITKELCLDYSEMEKRHRNIE